MKIDIDIERGVARAEFSLDELAEIMDALRAVQGTKPATPDVQRLWKLPVESSSQRGHYHETRIWFDSDGDKHGTCQCGDSVYRRNWCKHLIESDRVRVAQARSATFS